MAPIVQEYLITIPLRGQDPTPHRLSLYDVGIYRLPKTQLPAWPNQVELRTIVQRSLATPADRLVLKALERIFLFSSRLINYHNSIRLILLSNHIIMGLP